MSLPDNLIALRDEAMQTSCDSWAIRNRWRLGPGIDRAGPCPVCGGNDRFSIHTKLQTFLCRSCGIAGKGVIKLVMETQNVDFKTACEIITGHAADAPIDPAKAARIAQQNAESERQRAIEADRYREKARRDGYEIWKDSSKGARRLAVLDYLKIRGLITSDLMAHFEQIGLRQHFLPYLTKLSTGWREIRTGPVMVAAVQLSDDRFGAVHQTWLDLTQDKGKANLVDPETGKDLPAKKVRGVKKGGAIRLLTIPGATRIIMGEGIESTLTALAHNFEPNTNYWAGVDLGNMSGKARRDVEGKQLHDLPDLADDECFLPPAWCTELVYLGETDAPEKHTIEKLIRGLVRAQHMRRLARQVDPDVPDLTTEYVEPPTSGGDLNDLVRVNL